MGRKLSAASALSVTILLACSTIQERMGREVFDKPLALSFDRVADLLPPEGLRVTSTEDRTISLGWNPILVGDVSGYVVTRSREASADYTSVGRTIDRFNTVYTDFGEDEHRLGDGQTYHYRVHPFDSEGRVSRSHAYIVATTDPTPSVPERLRSFSNLPRHVVLEWQPSENPSVDGYSVFRSPTVAGPWEPVGYVEGRLQSIFDDPVTGDLRVMYYRIAAANRFGGESEMTEPIRSVTKAEPLPPIKLELADLKLGQALLVWESNTEKDLKHYEVWREDWRENSWKDERRVAEIDPNYTRMMDLAVGCEERARYRVRAIDTDALVSEFSDPVEIIGQDIKLQVDPKAASFGELSWDQAETVGWTPTRITRRRGLFPDQAWSEIAEGTRFPLPELGPGTYSFAVTVRRAALPKDSGPYGTEREDSVTCALAVEIREVDVAARPKN